MSELFSIVIPCFNQGHYLHDSVESILAQTYKHWQLIIVNDGSTDNTSSIADDFAKNNDRIHAIHQTNTGLAMARNNGFAKTDGELVMFLDADDKLRYNCLEIFAEALSKEKDIAVSGYAYFNDQATVYKEVFPAVKSNEMQQLLIQNIAPPVAFAMRRLALLDIGLFDKFFNPAEDWDLWIRFYKANKQWAVIPKILVDYRVVPSSMSRNALKMYEGFKQVAESAVLIDNRIKLESGLNRNYPEINKQKGIQHSLAISLGLLIMQGKEETAIKLFQEETKAYNLTWNPEDFTPMCSFLSFRYWISANELKKVLDEFTILFNSFFDATGYNSLLKNEAMNKIFKHHYMLRNKRRFGPLAPLLNRRFR